MVNRKLYPAPPVCRREALRYAGCREETPEVAGLLDEVLEQALPALTYQVCWREFPISVNGGVCELGFARVNSAALAKNLAGCGKIVLFGATVGVGMDRLIARYGRTSPAKGVMAQALGAERIEALCDAFCGELAERKGAEGLFLRPRFSPGYGDLPLALQTDIVAVLDCPRQIGLTLNSSLLMSPSKSVTAIVGLSGQGREIPGRSCASCGSQSCDFRSK